MQVNETLAEGLKREYTIQVDAGEIDKEMNARLAQIGQKAKIPGFRPGKVPASVLKQRYGQSVRGEVLDQTVRNTSQKVMQDKNLRVAVPPAFEVKQFEEGQGLEYVMRFELFPDIPEVSLDKMTLERCTFTVADKDIDEGLDRLAERHKEPEAISSKRACKEGDLVTIDFLGKLGGTPFEGGEGKGFKLELGSGQMIPGFEDQIAGMKVGEEKVITVTFPEGYHKQELAGQETTFDIKLHEISELKVPDVDEAFATKLGFESLEDIRSKVREQLEKDYSAFVRNLLKKGLFDELDGSLSFDLPESMVDQEFNSIWSRIDEAKQQGSADLDGKSDDELKKEYRQLAERRVKLGLFLAEVANEQKLQVSPDELRQAVFDQARMFPGQEQRVIEYYQKDPNNAQELVGPLLEEKSVDWVLEQVSYKDVEKSLDELLTMNQQELEGGESKPKKKTASKPKAKTVAKKSADSETSTKSKAKTAPKKGADESKTANKGGKKAASA